MTPLVLLVGFLGAGKTTFLRRVLPELKKQGLVPHVIINDYQNAQVDAAFLQEVAEAVKPISGSCVCCESREELLNTLAEIPLGANSVLLVETNGTTDAEELVELLTLDRRTRRLTLPLQVTVIDAKRWQKRYWHNGLERGQLTTATQVVISRQDEVAVERFQAVIQDIRRLSPQAESTSPEKFAEKMVTLVSAANLLPPRLAAEPETPGKHDESDHPHHHHDTGEHHFSSLEIRLPKRVKQKALLDFLQRLPEEVLRAKGLAVLEESPGTVHLFQRVGADETVLFSPLQAPTPFPPLLILIGVHLPEASLRAQVAALA